MYIFARNVLTRRGGEGKENHRWLGLMCLVSFFFASSFPPGTIQLTTRFTAGRAGEGYGEGTSGEDRGEQGHTTRRGRGSDSATHAGGASLGGGEGVQVYNSHLKGRIWRGRGPMSLPPVPPPLFTHPDASTLPHKEIADSLAYSLFFVCLPLSLSLVSSVCSFEGSVCICICICVCVCGV